MIDSIVSLQSEFISSKSNEERKKLGQFYTGSIVSDFMASLITKINSKKIRILDAGAGAGILTVSAAMRCFELGCTDVHAVLYELDEKAAKYLERAMSRFSQEHNTKASKFTFEIRNQDFILSRPDKDESIEPFHLSVINPPYFKYSVKESPYSKATSDLFKGDPNIYASFMATVMSCMLLNGQMIVIAPRSFTNGLYFKGFRQYMGGLSSIERIHIFNSRSRVFKERESSVLQENVIFKFVKRPQAKNITVSSSTCNADIQNAESNEYPDSLIIDSTNEQRIIRVPETLSDAHIMLQAENLPTHFEAAGYFISTGPVVEHRTRDYICKPSTNRNTTPLLRPHNIKPSEVVWSGKHNKDVKFKLKSGHDKHTIKKDVYVLLKRFTSKDERRRLVAAVFNPKTINEDRVGFGNKLNYIGVKGKSLTLVEAYGLAALFNSTFMDKYFRCISGNTQVNATEIRIIKFPSRETVKVIGRIIKKVTNPTQDDIDEVVNCELGI